MAKSEATIIEFDTDAIRAREAEVSRETDEQIKTRLRARFSLLEEMTEAVKLGHIRALIVSGPPGVGKSYGVENVLEKQNLFNKIAQRKPKFEIVKGASSSVGLYAKLFEYKDCGNVLVFDDCDDVLLEELNLNILKGALDSSKRRWISWNRDSRLLRQEGIPNRFEFSAGVIFITNIKFDYVRSKKLRSHLQALEDRCHYLDLKLDTVREQLLRIRQVVDDGMLQHFEFEEEQKKSILEFVETNVEKLNVISLRAVHKIAELCKAYPDSWKEKSHELIARRHTLEKVCR